MMIHTHMHTHTYIYKYTYRRTFGSGFIDVGVCQSNLVMENHTVQHVNWNNYMLFGWVFIAIDGQI